MIVVDTSVLVDFLRGRKTDAAERLRRMEEDLVPFAIPAICGQEVLQGARDQREWKVLFETLDSQRILVSEHPWKTHAEAARIFFDCRRRGLTIRGTVDCLIAQMVMEIDGVLLHDDDDFEKVRAVRPLRTLRK